MSDELKSAAADEKSWKLIEKTVLASVQEQRRGRRWGIFFKILMFAYLFIALFVFSPFFKMVEVESSSGKHTALIDIRGMIADQELASADTIVGSLRKAFKDPQTQAVILRINSPGGSPVQSAYVYDEIRRLRAEHESIKVYAVISDLGASGAYYIASAADEIYANKSSLVGSIGVTAAGFGFVGAIEKLGVERRAYTSGDHKAFLDPFQPQKEDEVVFWESVLDEVHEQFIAAVKAGRGERLKFEQHPEIFSGLIWSGEQALGLGLIDGLGSAGYVAREVIGEPAIKDFTVKQSPFERFTQRLGTSIAEHLALSLGLQQAPALR